jgi:hypothetical protein
VAAVSLGTVLGLIVSVSALVATVVIGLLRFKHERMLDDRADARSILAEGALELGHLKSAMKTAFTTFTKPLETGDGWEDCDYGGEVSKLEQAGEALEAALAAVRIRFKQDSAVVVELAAALAAARSVITVYFLARNDDLAGGKRRERKEEKGGEDYSEVMQLSVDFDNHRDAYLAAARDVVGVDLD